MMKFWAGYFVTQFQTITHKFWVAYYMMRLFRHLPHGVSRLNWVWRVIKHDWSKFKWDEASYFARTIFDLNSTTYGSDEYRELLRQIRPAIHRHYRRHDHHPEHWIAEGEFMGYVWERMPEIAKLEMICDWAAAVRRHADGDFERSIEANQVRWAMSDGLIHWLRTKAKLMGAL